MTNPPDKAVKRIAAAYAWATSLSPLSSSETTAQTRDVFRARLDRFYKEAVSASGSETDSSLLTAVAGEIGNNCFDHNLGQWRDEPGCWFEWGFFLDKPVTWVVLADRGQGVLASLGRVDMSIHTDQEATRRRFFKDAVGAKSGKARQWIKIRETDCQWRFEARIIIFIGQRPNDFREPGAVRKNLCSRASKQKECPRNLGFASRRKIVKIEVKKFGEILTSRTEGREAYLVARAYLKPVQDDESVELDFDGVKVLTPSWADEFISGLRSEYGARLKCLPSTNPTVIASLQIVG